MRLDSINWARGADDLPGSSERKWPGDASLEVAWVWWRKGGWRGDCALEEKRCRRDHFSADYVPGSTAGKAISALANERREELHWVRIVLGMGFVLEPEDAQRLLDKDPRNADVLFPYLHGEDLNSRWDQSPSRWVINFRDWPMEKAREYHDCFEIVERLVMPERTRKKPDGSFQLRYPLYERGGTTPINGQSCTQRSPKPGSRVGRFVGKQLSWFLPCDYPTSIRA